MSFKQNIYIRKLNGLGEKISVQDTVTIKDLKQIIRSLHSLQSSNIKHANFNLIFKGKNITEKQQYSLKELCIPSDGIIHLVFVSEQGLKSNSLIKERQEKSKQIEQSQSCITPNININISKPQDLSIRIIFNEDEHIFLISPLSTVLDLKKLIAAKLNLVYQSLILSHLGCEMVNQKVLREYSLANQTLISLKFNLQKPQKKKLQSRMVSSVTLSDQNNEPNTYQNNQNQSHFDKDKLVISSKSIGSNKGQLTPNPKRIISLIDNNKPMMYQSQIHTIGNVQGSSKAALMFKNALHQKIMETQSVVSGSFSQDTSMAGCDPNSIMILIKNEEQTKEYLFECSKTHQMNDIKEKIVKIEKIAGSKEIQISLEEDLFQSIDLNKSGCITLSQIIKKMGKQRAVFTYRVISC